MVVRRQVAGFRPGEGGFACGSWRGGRVQSGACRDGFRPLPDRGFRSGEGRGQSAFQSVSRSAVADRSDRRRPPHTGPVRHIHWGQAAAFIASLDGGGRRRSEVGRVAVDAGGARSPHLALRPLDHSRRQGLFDRERQGIACPDGAGGRRATGSIGQRPNAIRAGVVLPGRPLPRRHAGVARRNAVEQPIGRRLGTGIRPRASHSASPLPARRGRVSGRANAGARIHSRYITMHGWATACSTRSAISI